MSDHFSGPRALAGPAGDISDVYAFPSPKRPGHLVAGDDRPASGRAGYARSRMRSSAASGCDRSRSRTTASRSPSARRSRSSSSPAPSMRRNRARTAQGPCRTAMSSRRPVRRHAFAWTTKRGRASTGCASTPACARTRSSSTCRPTWSRSRPAGSPSNSRGRTSRPTSTPWASSSRSIARRCSGRAADAICRRGGRDGGRRQAPDPHRAVRPPRDQERDHVR